MVVHTLSSMRPVQLIQHKGDGVGCREGGGARACQNREQHTTRKRREEAKEVDKESS